MDRAHGSSRGRCPTAADGTLCEQTAQRRVWAGGGGGRSVCAAAGGWWSGGRMSPCGLSCRGVRAGCWIGWVVRFDRPAPTPTPTRNPPWRGIRFALPCRRVRAGLRPAGSRCRLPVGKVVRPVSVWRGAEKTASWGGVDVTSDNLGRQQAAAGLGARAPLRLPCVSGDERNAFRPRVNPAAPPRRPTRARAAPSDAAPCRAFFRAPVRPRAPSPNCAV